MRDVYCKLVQSILVLMCNNIIFTVVRIACHLSNGSMSVTTNVFKIQKNAFENNIIQYCAVSVLKAYLSIRSEES